MRVISGVLVAAFALSLTASWWDNDLTDTIVWHSYGVVVAVAMWVAVARRAASERRGWAAIAVGLTAWVGGDIAWDVLAWNAPLPDVSIVDAFYLVGYAAFLLGVVLLVRSSTSATPREATIDGLIFAIAFGLVFWVTLVQPASDPGSAGYAGVTLAYPTLAIALLAAICWLRFHPDRRRLPAGTSLLSWAVALLVVLEPLSAWYWYVEPEWDIDVIPIIDRAFLFAFGLIVLAGFHSEHRGERAHRDDLHPLRLGMLGLALAVGPFTMMLVEGSQRPAVIAATLISCLVLLRFALLSRERERARAALAYQANHDPLTGLGNRSMLQAVLDDISVTVGDEADNGLALLYLDVDSFKSINDTHGHAVGDALLSELSERIRSSVRPGDVAARLGGDEFVILCCGAHHLVDAQAVAERLTAAVSRPFAIGDLSLSVTISIGMAAAPAQHLDADRLMRSADAALYRAKRTGRDAIVQYTDEVGMELDARNQLERALTSSLATGGLTLELAPIVDVSGDRTGSIAVLSAAMSATEPTAHVDVDLGLIGPDQATLALRIGTWTVDAVVHRLLDDPRRGPVFLQATRSQLGSPEFIDHVCSAMASAPVDPGSIVLEIPVLDLGLVAEREPQLLDRLMSTGVRLGVHGFGGPESSLFGCQGLPYSIARLDLARADLDFEVLGSVVSLVSDLGLEAIVQRAEVALEHQGR